MAFSKQLLAGLAVLIAMPTSHAATPFRGRIVTGSFDSVLPNVSKRFDTISPERSLLLYDCNPTSWCADKTYSFLSIFDRATFPPSKTASQPTAPSMRGLLGSVGPNLRRFLGTALIRPLAIVNRMDLANFDQNSCKWTGAELRFVYGRDPLKSNRIQPTIIFEFVLPPQNWGSFKQLAQAWDNLKGGSLNPLPEDLATALALIDSADIVRIRVNAPKGAAWEFSNWEVSRNASAYKGKWLPTPLEYQFDPALDPNRQDYRDLWTSGTDSGNAIEVLPKTLLASPPMQYPFTLSTPPNATIPPGRGNTLALQQCSGCHSEATQTPFQHISNSGPPGKATLSGFITGNPTNSPDGLGTVLTLPKISNLTFLTPPNSWTVDSRSFNDIARRALFLASVLEAPDTYTAGAAIPIQAFRTNFAH